MANRTRVVVVCDRDRSDVDAVATVEVRVNGERQRIDLCAAHLAEFRKQLRPWLSSGGRGRSGGSRSGGSRRSSPRSGESAALRTWAREQGYDVGERGRIAASIRQAYEASKSES